MGLEGQGASSEFSQANKALLDFGIVHSYSLSHLVHLSKWVEVQSIEKRSVGFSLPRAPITSSLLAFR